MAEQEPAPMYAIALKLPDFWPSDPELWFAQVEALFEAQNITQEKTKFAHVVRYKAIKDELQKRVCMSRRQQLQQLLHLEDLGDRKPSQLLRHMLKLRGGTAADADQDEIFREIFLQKLPLTVRTALAIHKGKTLRDLAEMADNMVEVQGPQQNRQGQVDMLQQEDPQIATLSSEIKKIWRAIQSQSKLQLETTTPKPEICWYHERFGAKATKCREPCTFRPNTGNEKASP